MRNAVELDSRKKGRKRMKNSTSLLSMDQKDGKETNQSATGAAKRIQPKGGTSKE